MAPECGYVVAGMPDVEWAAWCCEDRPLLQLFGARWIPAAYDQGVLEELFRPAPLGHSIHWACTWEAVRKGREKEQLKGSFRERGGLACAQKSGGELGRSRGFGAEGAAGGGVA